MSDAGAMTDTEEQAALREAVRDFAGQHTDASAWKRLTGELGLTALAIPERYDGMGAGLAEVAVAAEEIGRVLLPVPYLSTALAGLVLAEAGAAEFLPAIVGGQGAAFALTGDVTAAGDRLTGTATHVLDGAGAEIFLVRAGDSLYAARGATATPLDTLDQTRTQATVTFRDTPAVRLGTDPGRAEDLLRVLLAVESVGAAEHCLDVTVAYVKTRVQFGRPIGTFQALKHRCADLAVEVASARATAHAAVRATPAELGVLAPLAKRHCVDVFWHVAAETIQLHGGIGFTWEHEAHRYLKRAKTTQLLHGTPAELRRLVAQRAGLT